MNAEALQERIRKLVERDNGPQFGLDNDVTVGGYHLKPNEMNAVRIAGGILFAYRQRFGELEDEPAYEMYMQGAERLAAGDLLGAADRVTELFRHKLKSDPNEHSPADLARAFEGEVAVMAALGHMFMLTTPPEPNAEEFEAS